MTAAAAPSPACSMNMNDMNRGSVRGERPLRIAVEHGQLACVEAPLVAGRQAHAAATRTWFCTPRRGQQAADLQKAQMQALPAESRAAAGGDCSTPAGFAVSGRICAWCGVVRRQAAVPKLLCGSRLQSHIFTAAPSASRNTGPTPPGVQHVASGPELNIHARGSRPKLGLGKCRPKQVVFVKCVPNEQRRGKKLNEDE